jgi:chorismate synthase
MSNTAGRIITLTLFGESHGPAIGAVLDGLPAGLRIDEDFIHARMNQRRAAGTISTARHEEDLPEFLSGIRGGFTEGTPIAILIRNEDVHRADYNEMQELARPGHADYAAEMKYHGYQDRSGGGHFSGRLTAPLVAAGAILEKALLDRGIAIGSHIADLHGIQDDSFRSECLDEQIAALREAAFPALSSEVAEQMKAEIEAARMQLDSVGGILETAVTGLKPGVGSPEFDSVESRLASILFSIPAVKGVEFGSGFGFAHLYGSEANDPLRMADGRVVMTTNHNGGINGGITNGMPVVFRTCIKPTPSIARPQETVNLKTMENAVIEIHGRHDPAVIHRARAAVDAMTAFALADLLAETYGPQWLAEANDEARADR